MLRADSISIYSVICCCAGAAGTDVSLSDPPKTLCLSGQGDLKLAFVITKGQFELDVICAKELRSTLPDRQRPGKSSLHV